MSRMVDRPVPLDDAALALVTGGVTMADYEAMHASVNAFANEVSQDKALMADFGRVLESLAQANPGDHGEVPLGSFVDGQGRQMGVQEWLTAQGIAPEPEADGTWSGSQFGTLMESVQERLELMTAEAAADWQRLMAMALEMSQMGMQLSNASGNLFDTGSGIISNMR
ncbi:MULTISPECIES: hypothetical protein [Roseomonadaceae]|uniref:Uncharacterized protein n=1 Tax=Falsiroseomonas oleicola TaxID=2801474 RepID=A0ABS6HAK5_9PROT|nr:hypothetical protein [Roseomonas oleicola]MBU8545746.1 hypothetical protein [Roseomonas oleicola]